jgi:hypothetical protein
VLVPMLALGSRPRREREEGQGDGTAGAAFPAGVRDGAAGERDGGGVGTLSFGLVPKLLVINTQ